MLCLLRPPSTSIFLTSKIHLRTLESKIMNINILLIKFTFINLNKLSNSNVNSKDSNIGVEFTNNNNISFGSCKLNGTFPFNNRLQYSCTDAKKEKNDKCRKNE